MTETVGKESTGQLAGSDPQPRTQTDYELLRRYEPVLRYTRGELFFPTNIEAYLRCCSLNVEDDSGKEFEAVRAGELTVERLSGAEDEWPGRVKHLRFVQEESLSAEARRFRQGARPQIPKSGRLAAVGVFGRILDVLVKISLLIRGAVPGGVAAAAVTRYREWVDDGGATYYGRVVRDGDYIILQYWFFYAMNDWRSIYGGVNDHEADWEKVFVYLTETPEGDTQPLWAGASSHEYTGDDLRRSWNDPDFYREGDHPVVFVGAGSHSHQMIPGDYLIQVDPAVLRWVVRTWRRLTERLFPSTSAIVRHGIGVPFVDYARGDGTRLGPGGDREWRAVIIDDDTPWVRGYRGLWGRDTRDFFEGERAPSGPRYERDGTVRDAWADPLTWVGLHKVAPTEDATRADLEEHLNRLEEQLAQANADIVEKQAEVRRLSAAQLVLRRDAHRDVRSREHTERLRSVERELAERYRERALTFDECEAHHRALATDAPLEAGPKDHLRSPHLPYASGEQPTTRFVHVWASLSTPLLLLALGATLLVPDWYRLLAMIGVVLLFAMVDAFARRKLLLFLTVLATIVVVVTVLAAIITAFMIQWRIALLVPLVVVVAVLLVVNIRDLMRR